MIQALNALNYDVWITGNNWDPELHRKAVELIKAGKITIPTSSEGWALIEKAITEDDLK